MAKRLLDLILAETTTLLLWPVIGICLILIFLQDGKWPVYSPLRAGKNNKPFRMHKMRTMVVGADKNKVDTTAANDARITRLGAFLRRYKLDELTQLWNIVHGEMSFVGPRPQIDREVALYTPVEMRLLSVRPGITDFSSIVFSDLGDIMAGHSDPNLAYNQLVRPWKSRLGLFYIDHKSCDLDVRLIILTAVAIISRPLALRGVCATLRRLGAPDDLVAVASRKNPLMPTPPPGADAVVTQRG
jgi:lipopolysaccharide/colanic/teichoic acid biosynthesis glycosyltransferase